MFTKAWIDTSFALKFLYNRGEIVAKDTYFSFIKHADFLVLPLACIHVTMFTFGQVGGLDF